MQPVERKCSDRAGPARESVMRWVVVVLVATILASPAMARAQEAHTLILELLRDEDPEIRALALEQVRTETRGEAATRKFAELLPTLPRDTQVGLLSALAARGDAAAAPEVRQLISGSEAEPVRVAALDAIGYLGDETDVPLLVENLAAGSEAAQKSARGSLIRLASPRVSQAMIDQMQKGPTATRLLLVEILTERRAGHEELLAATGDADPQIRRAAMKALGQIAEREHLAEMVQGVLKAQPGSERVAAEQALAAACHRIREPEQQAEPLLSAMEKLDPQRRLELMPALGRVGGPAALAAVEEAYADQDAAEHAAGVTALCNWPDGAVVARLLEIARTDEHPEHRTLARRALIRIAPLEDARSDARRLDLIKTLAVMCSDDRERNQLLQRAKAVRTVETLRFVAPFMDRTPLSQQACATVVELAHDSGLRERHQEEFHRALDKVIATSQDATVIDRAQRYQRGQTWVRPKRPE
jgi:HEAT repeat protein